MDGEQGGHQGAGPQRGRQSPQREEQEDGRAGVQQDAGEVVPPGSLLVGLIAAMIDLAIEHVRKPGQRMPVGGGEMGKGPTCFAETEAAGDMGILIDILPVVEVDEPVLLNNGPAEDRQNGNHKEATDGQDRFGRFHPVSFLL